MGVVGGFGRGGIGVGKRGRNGKRREGWDGFVDGSGLAVADVRGVVRGGGSDVDEGLGVLLALEGNGRRVRVVHGVVGGGLLVGSRFETVFAFLK